MRKIAFPLVGFWLLVLIFSSIGAPASTVSAFQLTDFPTPTPGPDGRILYTVQSGDSLWRISAVSGVSLNDLRLLNNLDAEDVILEGQVLILGLGGPAVATAPAPGVTLSTPTPSGPTPTAGPGTAIVCVLLFDDLNGDALRQESEVSIEGGAVSLSERTGIYAETITTLPGTEPECFEDVPQGEYNISVAIPDGYNPTTGLNLAESVNPGDEKTLNFGAQLSSQAALDNPSVEEGGRSPLLGVLGIALLLVGVGLGIFSTRMGKNKQLLPK